MINVSIRKRSCNRIVSFYLYLVTDSIDNEATQDNNTLFSEIQLTGDIDESSTSETAIDTDFRLSRLRRSTTINRRMSSSVPTRANSISTIEKVSFIS